ncbi:hypothetical protein B0H13DRAFT_2331978 [Mycena leptocephala]|nr:hypothetical protein B0H13DRAFT_2331978 [Mycena leptocephala]
MSTPSVDSTLGALELGTLFGTFLFGLVTVQCSSYFRDYPKDGLLLKSAVATMWFLELGHTVLTWHMVYSLSVTYYGQPEHIAEPPATFALTVLLGQTICFMVQIFFANRIHLFSKSWLIPVICWVLTLAHYSLDITALGILLKFGELSILRDRFDWIVAGALALGTAVDVLMTVTLCYRLWRIRDSSFHRGAGVFELSLFLTRDDLWWTVFYLMQASLFSNSMLVAYVYNAFLIVEFTNVSPQT